MRTHAEHNAWRVDMLHRSSFHAIGLLSVPFVGFFASEVIKGLIFRTTVSHSIVSNAIFEPYSAACALIIAFIQLGRTIRPLIDGYIVYRDECVTMERAFDGLAQYDAYQGAFYQVLAGFFLSQLIGVDTNALPLYLGLMNCVTVAAHLRTIEHKFSFGGRIASIVILTAFSASSINVTNAIFTSPAVEFLMFRQILIIVGTSIYISDQLVKCIEMIDWQNNDTEHSDNVQFVAISYYAVLSPVIAVLGNRVLSHLIVAFGVLIAAVVALGSCSS